MSHTEPFSTYKQVAKDLNLPYHKIQRSGRNKLFPVYKFNGGRPLVRRSEVIAAIEASQTISTEPTALRIDSISSDRARPEPPTGQCPPAPPTVRRTDALRTASRGNGVSSANPSEPVQLDLFDSLERLTGNQWRRETTREPKSSRDFILPPASTPAAEPKPTDSPRASAQSASAPPSMDGAGND